MKTFAAIVVLLPALIAGMGAIVPQERSDSEKQEKLSEFMNHKLDSAKEILSGLSRRDLQAVAQNADTLGLICIDISWNVIQSEEYIDRSTTFRRTLGALAKAARDDKFERAELHYLDVIGQCFSCHDFVRDRKRGK